MTLTERILPALTADRCVRECLGSGPGVAQLTVSGSCMEPALKPGMQIALKKPSSPPRVGDVVLLRTAAGLRLHRIVFRDRTGLRTKGDRGIYLDPVSAENDVLAVWESGASRITSSIRAGISLVRLLKRPWAQIRLWVTQRTTASCHQAND